MVGDHAEAHVVLMRGAVAASGELDGAVQDRAHLIGLVHVLDALLEERDAFQAHAGVDVLPGQLPHDVELGLAADVLDEVLHEHEVPDLQEPGVVGRRAAVLAVRGSAIEEDLRVGAAGTGLSGVPVVVGAAEPLDALGLQPDDVAPDRLGLVVGLIDRDPEILLLEAVAAVGFGAGEQLPGVADRALFEVVAERPIAHHLEESAVTRRLADLFDVVRADALLHVGDPRVRRRHHPGEVGDERHHSGDREQQRGVVADEGGRGDDDVVVLLEEIEIALRDLRSIHGGSEVLA